ncbi:sensor histidine kinase [Anaerocolumna xylanovorans]|uniref:histidine kinase n=1 Tax=Anaerocolumna xylanovorans DSM 12503 TaxID=1121345 RepID=A0A1M7YM88_9FIRM|nr:HAMP domain-containing sensor histidine kinase [Anaerocolumna xylanovorans]SHO53741.1 Signal transduction histidine kinase [Anaerocolumna xylanovorans DSM 12503]
MNRIKGSVYIKILIHIALFLSGLTLTIGTYHIFTYLDSYTTNIMDFKETSEFQNKFLKYVERVAVYVDYREKGYSGSIGFDSSSSDISSLFEKEVYNPKTKKKNTDASSEQEKFDYYNAILNQTNSNFLYYVKNIKTGDVYASAGLENKVYKTNEKDKNKMTLKEYLEHVKLTNSAYLIINTETEKYATNVNRNYQYLNDENLSWVIDYIKGNVINGTDNTETNRGDYIICTTIVNNFPNKADEFGTMYHHFNLLYRNYSNSLHPVPISFVMLLVFLILTVFFTGHSKNSDEIVLLGFDKLKTESGLILLTGGIAILYTVSVKLCKYLYHGYSFDYSILLGIGYSILYPFCMFGLLSLVRRVKKNILISDSYLRIFGLKLKDFIRKFFAERSITFRFAGLLLLFAAIETAGFLIYKFALVPHRIQFFLIVSILGYLILFYVTIKQVIDFKIISLETKKLADGDLNHKIPVENMHEPALSLALDINNISEGFSAAVDEKVKSERLKTELIANVSHDIKTPLTSIINYVDLLKKENLNNETAKGYLDVLSGKTWRLKTLIEDLVEASKASSGTLVLNLECLNLVELVRQSLGEFEDKFADHKIETVLTVSQEPLYIMADGRSTYRIIENIFSNVVKYALSGTRAYINIYAEGDMAVVSVKNISAAKLNISSEELMERFVRGDSSRNTEGSGLGLSISKSLAAVQEGTFDIELDGDLFKAVLKFGKLNDYTNEIRIAKESDILH